MTKHLIVFLATSLLYTPGFASNTPDAQSLFKKNCAMCHAVDRRKMGPALKDMSSDAKYLRVVISNGRQSMPGFSKKLNTVEISALVDYLLANQ